MKSGFYFAAVLASATCLISGCNGVSSSDEQFIAASMPSAFDAFRMYNPGDASKPRQACTATIRTPQGEVNEVVVLEHGSGMVFDIAATRDGSDWTITSDGVAPTRQNSSVFRYLLVDCVSALEDKYRAQPYGYRDRESPLHR